MTANNCDHAPGPGEKAARRVEAAGSGHLEQFHVYNLPWPHTVSGHHTFAAVAESNGQLGFSSTVNGDFSNVGNAALFYNLENKIWNNVLRRVKSDCLH